MTFAMTDYMPVRGERRAPIFDHEQPSMLRQYFAQLDRLFTRCAITSDLEKKDFATSFLEADIADCWEALPEFINATKTYAQFRYRLFDLYNQITDRYSLHNLARLIADQNSSGIQSLQELSTFHLRYNAISSYLIDQGILSLREQSQQYLRVFDAICQSQIDLRLQIKYPQHSPSRPHSINAIFEAAQWILAAPANQALSISTVAIQMTSQPAAPHSSDSSFVKTEQLSTILSAVSKTIVATITHSNAVQTASEMRTTSKPTISTALVSTKPTNTAASKETVISTAIASVSHSTVPIARPITTASLSPEIATLAAQERVQALEEEICKIHASSRRYNQTKHGRYIMPEIQAPATLTISNRSPSNLESVPLTRRLGSRSPQSHTSYTPLMPPLHSITSTVIPRLQPSKRVVPITLCLSPPVIATFVVSPVIVANAIASPTISPIAIELVAPEPSRPLVSSIAAPIVTLIISLFIVLLNLLAHTVTSPLIATLARLSLRIQQYIRNHARLKYARFDIGT